MEECTFIVSGGAVDSDFLAGELKKATKKTIIAADRGLEACLLLAQKGDFLPDYVIGDFDSLAADQGKTLQTLQKQGTQVIRLNPIKDDTDTEAALRLAFEKTVGDIYIFGGTGTRLDHVLGNLSILIQGFDRGRSVLLIDPWQRIRMIRGEWRLPRQQQFGKYVSVFPWGGAASGVTLEGFAYPLQDVVLEGTTSLGVSNEITGELGRILVRDGTLLVVESRD
jgi:thiamine pyrophosphokinase